MGLAKMDALRQSTHDVPPPSHQLFVLRTDNSDVVYLVRPDGSNGPDGAVAWLSRDGCAWIEGGWRSEGSTSPAATFATPEGKVEIQECANAAWSHWYKDCSKDSRMHAVVPNSVDLRQLLQRRVGQHVLGPRVVSASRTSVALNDHTTAVLARTAVALRLPAATDTTNFLGSTTTLRIGVDPNGDAAAIITLRTAFGNPARYGYTALEVVLGQASDVNFCVTVVKARLPLLRRLHVVRGNQELGALDWTALATAAVNSSFLEALIIAERMDAVGACRFTNLSYRATDEHVPIMMKFDDHSLGLRRRVPLRSVKECIPCPLYALTAPDVTLIFFNLRVTVHQSCLRFSTVLHDLLQLTRAQGGNTSEICLSDTYSNADGDEESENRWSTVDVRLAALWMNEYAEDDVHRLLIGDATARHHISLNGQHFYDNHINKSRRKDAALKRCVSLLALAHFLCIPTLECQVASLAVMLLDDD